MFTLFSLLPTDEVNSVLRVFVDQYSYVVKCPFRPSAIVPRTSLYKTTHVLTQRLVLSGIRFSFSSPYIVT